ncbi:MAG TPA: hypothetical protein VL574_14025 [Stellaceae bacterium]|nr:hypothetical protein [Stellaceae bacterium]
MDIPDEAVIEIMARAAGLGRAWEQFRGDVVAAACQVASQRPALAAVQPADDPWPPMRVAEDRRR